MKVYHILIAMSFVIASCQSTTEDFCDCNEILQDGMTWELDGNPYTGHCETHYSDGSIESSSEFINGLMNGTTKFYYQGGKIQEELSYDEGIQSSLKYHEV